MVDAEELFEEGKTDGLEFGDDLQHFWKCYQCRADTATFAASYERIDGYDRKGVVRCDNCGYKELVHLFYKGEKRMTDLVRGDKDDPEKIWMVLVYYWTGKHRVKALIERGPTVLDVYREPRPSHPGHQKAKHSDLTDLATAAKGMDMMDHLDYSELAVPNETKRAGVDREDVDT